MSDILERMINYEIKKLSGILVSLLAASTVFSMMPFAVSAVQPETSYEASDISSAASEWVIYTGGEAPYLSRNAKLAFQEAAASYNGGKVEPVLLYSTGIVSGVNYSMIIREYNDDGTAVLKNARIYDPNFVNSTQRTGKARFISVENFDPAYYQQDAGYYLPSEPLVGGSSMEYFSTCDLPAEVELAFEQATSNLIDTEYQPVAYLGKKTSTEGTYYALLCCKYNPNETLPDRFLDVVTLLKGTDGQCKIRYSCSIYGQRYKFPDQFKNLSNVENTTIYKGQSVRINLAASGGSRNYSYTVSYRKMNTGKWITVTPDSNADHIIIKPSTACTYELVVTVSDGKSERSNFNYIWVNEKLVNTTTLSATTISKGQTVTVNCSSTGGSGTKKYAVYYKKKSSDKWSVAQKFSKNTTVKIKPMTATNYDVCVKVQDDHGSVVKKYYNVSCQNII